MTPTLVVGRGHLHGPQSGTRSPTWHPGHAEPVQRVTLVPAGQFTHLVQRAARPNLTIGSGRTARDPDNCQQASLGGRAAEGIEQGWGRSPRLLPIDALRLLFGVCRDVSSHRSRPGRRSARVRGVRTGRRDALRICGRSLASPGRDDCQLVVVPVRRLGWASAVDGSMRLREVVATPTDQGDEVGRPRSRCDRRGHPPDRPCRSDRGCHRRVTATAWVRFERRDRLRGRRPHLTQMLDLLRPAAGLLGCDR